MEIHGVQTIRLPQTETWAALNDPKVLRRAVPGCQRFEKVSDNRYAVQILWQIGSASTLFDGTLTLFNLQPPHACSMSYEGAGQGVGTVLGEAEVRLISEEAETTLAYRATMQVSGVLAQAGPRLLEEAARRMVEGFFARFKTATEPDAGRITGGAPESAARELWLAPLWSFAGGFAVGLILVIAAAILTPG